MTTWVGLLRAVNLGATRRFSGPQIADCLTAAGFTDVRTHGGTGNVLATTTMRSPDRVRQAMEAAFLADRGFEVPVVLLAPGELAAVADRLDEVGAGHEGLHHVSFLQREPGPEVVRALEAVEAPGERLVVQGRAVHLLLGPLAHRSRLGNHVVERLAGVATARSAGVVATLAERWAGGPTARRGQGR